MSQQNLVAGTLNDADKTEVLAAIQTIKTKLPFLITLTPDERRSLPRMGDASTAYVQQAYEFASANMDKLGADFGMADYTSDFKLEQQMRPIETALTDLAEGVSDTMLGLRSDLMVRSNLAYAMSKLLGKSSGAFDELRKAMGVRFKAQGKRTTPPTPQSGGGGGGSQPPDAKPS